MNNKIKFETKRIIGISAILSIFLIYFLNSRFVSGLKIAGNPSILLMIVGVLLIIQYEKINEYNKILGGILIAASLIMNLPIPIEYCLKYGFESSFNAPAILISLFGNLYLIFCAIVLMMPSTIVKNDNIIYCPECGEKLNKDVQFCSKCGTKIE